MKKLLVLVLVLILVGVASWADTFGTGQWLHDLWASAQKANNHTATLSEYNSAFEYSGFVIGAASVMYDLGWLDLRDITYGQWVAVVGKYLDANPEQWNRSAERLIFYALYAAWPGKNASPYQE
jgi:hypothetical protein